MANGKTLGLMVYMMGQRDGHAVEAEKSGQGLPTDARSVEHPLSHFLRLKTASKRANRVTPEKTCVVANLQSTISTGVVSGYPPFSVTFTHRARSKGNPAEPTNPGPRGPEGVEGADRLVARKLGKAEGASRSPVSGVGREP